MALFHTFQHRDDSSRYLRLLGGYFYSFTLLYLYSHSITYFVLIYAISMLIYFIAYYGVILLYLHFVVICQLFGRFYMLYLYPYYVQNFCGKIISYC